MAHHIMVQATPLPNVRGRVKYISSERKQENLVAVFSSTNDPTFWRDLANHCQEQAKYSKSGKACEGRELMVMLANELSIIKDGQELAKDISEVVKKLTGTENVVGVHWNKEKNNFHAHIVFSENQEVNIVKRGAVLTRNTYFNSEGQRSNKRDCIDANGELLPGCSFVPKGSCKEEIIRFGAKNEALSSKSFLRTVKQQLADLQNDYLQEQRFELFKDDGLHIPQQHIGKKVTEEIERDMRAKNAVIRHFNNRVDEILETAEKVSEESFLSTTEELKRVRSNIKSKALQREWGYSIWHYERIIKKRLEEMKKFLATRKRAFNEIMGSAQERNEQMQAAYKAQEKEPGKEHAGNSDNDNQDFGRR